MGKAKDSAALASAWHRAADDLGIEVVAPYTVHRFGYWCMDSPFYENYDRQLPPAACEARPVAEGQR